MNKIEVVILLVQVIEMTLAVAIGIYLLLFKIKKVSFLGWSLLIYGIAFLPPIFVFFTTTKNLPVLYLMPFSLACIHSSLLYCHVDSLIIQGDLNRRKKFIFTGVLLFLLGGIIILFHISKIENITSFSLNEQLYLAISILYLLFTYCYSIHKILKHKKLVKAQYSDTEKREPIYILHLLIYAIVFICVGMPLLMGLSMEYLVFVLIAEVFNAFWILGIAYTGLYYKGSEDLFKIKISKKISSESGKNDKMILHKEICDLIEKKQLFLNPDLTVLTVAHESKKHQKVISEAINVEKGMNFNSFINLLRVEYAKELLEKKEFKHLSIVGIGKSAGFKSNSAFYRAFKKHFKRTPLQYQKERFK